MPSNLQAVGAHIFTKEELEASVNRMLGQLPPDREVGLGFAVDHAGVSAALMWHKQVGTWNAIAAAAVTRDWSGNLGAGGSVTLSK